MVRISLKTKAEELRKNGLSYKEIEKKLNVSRSTLNGWLKDVLLTEGQRARLRQNWIDGLVKARAKAILIHNKRKLSRLKEARLNSLASVKSLDLKNKNILKLALAMFFIGEGFKKAEETSLGNSDPESVRAFVSLIDSIYGFDKSRARIYLHLRADQNISDEIKFWSQRLEIEPEYFKIAPVDKRTYGRPTYNNYHGVCVVRYYDVSIKREILGIAKVFFKRMNN